MKLFCVVSVLPAIFSQPDLVWGEEDLLQLIAALLHSLRQLLLEVLFLLLGGFLAGTLLLLAGRGGRISLAPFPAALLEQAIPEQIRGAPVALSFRSLRSTGGLGRGSRPGLLVELPPPVRLELLPLPALLPLLQKVALLEDSLLAHGDPFHKDLHPLHVDVLPLGQVSYLGHGVLVHRDEQVQGPLPDLQGWHVRQEVISTEEAQQNEVVDEPLRIHFEARLHSRVSHVQNQVLPQRAYVDHLVRLPVDP
mmetsp:Transcript_1502/g.4336  ORF Transcript_1502/g.4336 Transcript_1502/m.4336 type:complete len:251 (-) Transcript_1502:829-1581(-)